MLRGRLLLNLAVVLVLIAAVAAAFGCQEDRAAFLGRDRNARWIKDIDYLAQELPERHLNLFFKTSEEDFEEMVEALKKSVPVMNDYEIRLGIKKIIASIGDAHTDCYIEPVKVYPMSLYWFQDGIYVIDTVEKYEPVLYKRIAEINGVDVNWFVEGLSEIIPRDNSAQLQFVAPYYMVFPEFLYGLDLATDIDRARFTFADSLGGRINVEMDAISAKQNQQFITGSGGKAEKPLYRRKTEEYYWYNYMPEERVLYFKYNRCLDMKGKPLKGIFKEMIELIDSSKVDKLVVDIRDNRGGSSPLLDPFIDEVTKRDINKSNRLFVIVGRATYSSAILNALHFRNETNATFLGEPTGGKPNHYGEVKSFKLPNSGIWVTYSTKYFTFNKGDPLTLMPDRIIEVALQDYIDGKDPVLDAVIRDY